MFHTNNFQMDPYGGASIYMIDIFGSFWATVVAYYLGVLLVLTIGMQIGYGVQKLVEKVNIEITEEEASLAIEAENSENETET